MDSRLGCTGGRGLRPEGRVGAPGGRWGTNGTAGGAACDTAGGSAGGAFRAGAPGARGALGAPGGVWRPMVVKAWAIWSATSLGFCISSSAMYTKVGLRMNRFWYRPISESEG